MVSVKAYLIPDPLPDGLRCFPVYIPDDQLSLSQFMAAFEHFGTWLAFERDDLKRGKDIAAIWKEAFEATRATLEDGCMQLDFRQNPTDPCLQEYSKDGGETWLLMFDHSLCPCPTTPPVLPPGGGSEPGEGNSSIAANNLMSNLYIPVIQMVDCSVSRAETITNVTNYIRTYDPTFANPTGIGQLYDQICALPPEEQEELQDVCKLMGRLLSEYGAFSACNDPYENLNAWIECARDRMVETLTEATDWLISTVNSVWANFITDQGIVNFGAGAGGAGGGSGFGHQDCPYLLVPLSSRQHELLPTPGGARHCEAWFYVIPEGFEFVAMWVDYVVSAEESPFYYMAMGWHSGCGAAPTPPGGETIVKGGTSPLSELYTAKTFRALGESTSIFTDVGYDLDDADPAASGFGGSLAASDLRGEMEIAIAVSWVASSDDGITGMAQPVLILRGV